MFDSFTHLCAYKHLRDDIIAIKKHRFTEANAQIDLLRADMAKYIANAHTHSARGSLRTKQLFLCGLVMLRFELRSVTERGEALA